MCERTLLISKYGGCAHALSRAQDREKASRNSAPGEGFQLANLERRLFCWVANRSIV
jgi:hypothetical protein